MTRCGEERLRSLQPYLSLCQDPNNILPNKSGTERIISRAKKHNIHSPSLQPEGEFCEAYSLIFHRPKCFPPTSQTAGDLFPKWLDSSLLHVITQQGGCTSATKLGHLQQLHEEAERSRSHPSVMPKASSGEGDPEVPRALPPTPHNQQSAHACRPAHVLCSRKDRLFCHPVCPSNTQHSTD